MLNSTPYLANGELSTPFYLNIYLDLNGNTQSSVNPAKDREASIDAANRKRKLNSRVRVTRVKGLLHRPDYDWD